MNNIPDNLDCREYEFAQGEGFVIVMYQAELVRIMNILNGVKNHQLAEKIKKIIYLRDLQEQTKTDFSRKVSKCDIARFVFSPREYIEYTLNRKELAKMMEDFYGRKKR